MGNYNNITGVLLIDIKAAFPSLARARLINTITAEKIHGNLRLW